MAITVKHKFVSAIPDGDDATIVRPSNWNDDHELTGTIPVANGGTGASTADGALTNLLPSQTGNNGKVLSTDGTNTSWTAAGGTGTVTSVAATAGTGISVTGSPITTSGTLTITNTAPDQTVSIASGTGISATGTYPNFTVTNTLPDQVVALTGAGTTTVTGTYPNFTITSSGGGGGGDVTGPASATDNAITRFDSTTGKLIQNSLVIIDDTGSVTGVNALTAESLTVNNNATLGSSNTDTLAVNSRITTDLEPNTDDAKDIGTSGRNWRDGFFSRNLQVEGKVVSPYFDALNSAGGALRNSSGTAQLQWGAGGGNNLSVDVAININPANAQVAISPSGTGSVTINPATAGTMNNMVIGGTTPLAGSFTDLSVTGTTSFDGSQGTAGQVLTSAGTGATPTWTTPTTGTVTSVTGTAPVVSSGGATPAISLAASYGDTQNPYASKTANFVLAAPNGSAGVPTFRAIVAADIPTLNQNTTGTASNVTGTVAIANGGTGATSAPAALTNLRGWTTTATAAGTTTLTNTSTTQQEFTGTTTQTVVLPVTSTLALGWAFEIINNSTGSLTVNSSGGNLVGTVTAGTTVSIVCRLTSGTTAASWDFDIAGFATETGTGSVVRATSPTISSATLAASLNVTATTQNINFGTSQTTGVLTIGNTAQTGTLTVGQSTVSQTTNIQAGATASASTKTINIGTGGLAGSTTTIAIGSTAGTSTTTLNGTVTLANALPVASGGTGLTTLTANYIPYGNGTGAFNSSSVFNYNGTTLTVGGTPPSSGRLNLLSSSGAIALALSDNINSSMYLRTASGGAIIGTDGGGILHLAAGGNTTAERRLSVFASGGVSIGNTTDPGATNLSVTGKVTAPNLQGPAFAVYRNTNQSVTTSTWTKVTLDTEEFDTNTNFDNATNYRFTPTVAGYYQINGAVAGSGTANTQTACTCAIYKNGTIYKQGSSWNSSASVTSNMAAVVSALIFFNGSTDYVELYGYNTQTSPVFSGGISQTYLSGSLVRSS
jgi:hypothetical protein